MKRMGCLFAIAVGAAVVLSVIMADSPSPKRGDRQDAIPTAVQPRRQVSKSEGVPLPTKPTTSPVPGRKFYVKPKLARVRETPSQSSRQILVIKEGHEVVEISRKGKWVEVGVARSGGKVGWVRAARLTETREGGKTEAPPMPAFQKFKLAFDVLNRSVKAQTGVVLFASAEDMGDGIVNVTATPTWLSGPQADREANLQTTYNLWEAAQSNDLPIWVNIVNPQGEIVMTKGGKRR